jgi:uncharacterized protein (DUF885 family)
VSSRELSGIVSRAVTSRLDHDPVDATYLGDHDRDGLLPDPSAGAAQARAGELRSLLADLDALPLEPSDDDVDGLTADEQVDAAVLRTALGAELFELEELREPEWNPMVHNPGGGLHALLSRDFAPLEDRLAALIRRMDAVPDYLAAARARLTEMSAVHADTARQQLTGTIRLLELATETAGEGAPQLVTEVAGAAERAREALEVHQRWLADAASRAARSPRFGERLFRDRLLLTLDTAFEPQALLQRAEEHLASIEQDMAERASRMTGAPANRETVRTVLDTLAADSPDDDTVLRHCVEALAETTAFVHAHDLVTVYDDLVDVVAMPEIDRGVAVAYCRPNGPLETADIPTEMAVSPAPAAWSPEQVRSFYREYNVHMLHGLTVHEAMPGHALQLMHSNRQRAHTSVRRLWPSGSFVEGWAVYAERLMADAGYRSDVSAEAADALRMQQLKMQLRMTINTILDIRFHCDDLDEGAALELMQQRGHQEYGEAAGKWRRVQLTSTQLCTYFVGYLEVSRLAADLQRTRPDAASRQRHDAMLAHGSPPPRHLRTLLGLGADA